MREVKKLKKTVDNHQIHFVHLKVWIAVELSRFWIEVGTTGAVRPEQSSGEPMQRTGLFPSAALCFPVLLFFLLLSSAPRTAQANTVLISVQGNEGAIPIEASATFGNTTFPLAGTLTVYRDNMRLGSVSGTGMANWSGTADGGALSQGAHTFTATACLNQGGCQSHSQVIVIDNTPEVTVEALKLEGDMGIHGIVRFKEHVGGQEGEIALTHLPPSPATSLGGGKKYEGKVKKWPRSFEQFFLLFK